MPITQADITALKMCSTCDEEHLMEPADVTVLYGDPESNRGAEVVPLCWSHADRDFWAHAKKTDVSHPATALAAWDSATMAERNVAVAEWCGWPLDECKTKAGERR